MHAYSFSMNVLIFFYSYLKRINNVRINNTFSGFQVILSGFPQGSSLRPILFQCGPKTQEVPNFSDDNTVTCSSDPLKF